MGDSDQRWRRAQRPSPPAPQDSSGLQLSDPEFRALIENALDLIAILNHEGVIRYISPSAERVLGYRPEELIGRYGFALIHPDDLQQVLDIFRQGLREPAQPRWAEYRFRHRDGSWRFLESHGRNLLDDEGIGGVVINSRDVTERKLAEERLVRSERQLAAAQALAHIGSWEWELDGDRLSCSDELNRIFGWEPGAAITYDTWLAATHDDDREATRAAIDTARLRRSPFQFQQRIVRPDESVRTLISSGGVVLDHLGQCLRMFCASQDITEQKQLESQLQHAQKLETLGVLAGGIAHDFNNLLMVILGNAELAGLQLAEESPARESISQIETAAVRAAELCKQMLAYSGKGKFIIRPLDLSKLVREMAELLEIAVAKKGALEYELAEDLPAIDADAAQVQQVVMNMITNAADSLEGPDGRVSIRSGVLAADNELFSQTYCESGLPEGLYVFLEVADNGCGMDAETRARIFDPFFTTKFTGRGLGMAAVLGIIRGHRGAISVVSEPGRGTTIRVLLPPSVQAPRGFGKEPPALAEQRGSGTLLVVDDEEMVAGVAKAILENAGFRVLTAADGHEALRIYADCRGEIDLVLMDMTMPRMNGEEAFARLRQLDPQARVVMASGYSEQDATNHVVSRNLAGFIQKPYRAGELVTKIRGLLDRAQAPAS
jgi:two-component system, cell cycle sensor histidine kinase and response regulator CckA